MALKLSPEYMISKYAKSATNGRSISVRVSRIIILALVALLVVVIVVTIQDYSKAKEATSRYNLNKAQLEAINRMYPNDNGKWDYARDEKLSGMAYAKADMNWYYFPIYFLLILFIVPWVIIRLSFWIIDAGKEKT